MITLDDYIRTGRRHAVGVLDILAAQHGEEAAKAFAGGLVAGARNYILGKYGPRATYDFLQGIADDVISPELAMPAPKHTRGANG